MKCRQFTITDGGFLASKRWDSSVAKQ